MADCDMSTMTRCSRIGPEVPIQLSRHRGPFEPQKRAASQGALSLGLSSFAEVTARAQRLRIKGTQDFHCANASRSLPTFNQDNVDPKTTSWPIPGTKTGRGAKTLRLAERRREAGRTASQGKHCHWDWDMMNQCDSEKWQWQVVGFNGLNMECWVKKNQSNSNKIWASMPGTPNLMPLVLGSWYEQLSDKNLYIQYCAQKIAFLLQTS